jgi:hypothetical protein
MTQLPTTNVPLPADPGATLTHKTVGGIRGHFFVPGYQRGYRWGKDEVRHLLNDIWSSGGEPYSLQPVVVKLRTAAALEKDREWELIDGQQRLTTLYLIMRYMHKELGQGMSAPYSLVYETRQDSSAYLASLTVAEDVEARNIDYFHMHAAYRTIHDWFTERGDEYTRQAEAFQLQLYLIKSIRVIWYEAPASTAAIPLFTRLNVGKIPLTAAELVKAALLTGAKKHASRDRAHEIASQWDAVERDLHDEDIWAFVAGLDSEVGDERYPTRISLLLDSLADRMARPHGRYDRFHTFATLLPVIEKDPLDFWANVVSLHAQILGWFRQPGIYNRIGYLVATGMPFAELALAAQGLRKSAFEAALVQKIRKQVDIDAERLSTLNYQNHRGKLIDLLLLQNVETVSASGQRFPFARHVGQVWSLEHIHAQNAEILNRAEQWRSWLAMHLDALEALPASEGTKNLAIDMRAAIAAIDDGKGSGDTFKALSRRTLELLNKDGDEADHFIHNLALLSHGQNSSLNNSVFEVKRQMILTLDRAGEYVPQCTRNVFLKYYTGADAQQPHFWSEQDKVSYVADIRARLQPYFK